MSDILPCYANRISTISHFQTDYQIKKYIDTKLKNWDDDGRNPNTGIILISITEEDENWKKWIKVLQQYKQVTFTRTRTKHRIGNYWCFLACIPCHPED